jgi:hypothetical protein
VRCGAVRCGAVRCGAVRCGAVRCGAVRCGAVRFGSVRFGSVRFGSVWCGGFPEVRGAEWQAIVQWGSRPTSTPHPPGVSYTPRLFMPTNRDSTMSTRPMPLLPPSSLSLVRSVAGDICKGWQ